jgi:hypothetical protein
MFWKKGKLLPQKTDLNFPHPFRTCCLHISKKHSQILFVPQGKTEIGLYVELDNIISDSWPCNLGKLQLNIELALNRYQPSATYVKGNWPSYNISKAKSQVSFEFDYISIWLETDMTRGYGPKEVERISVSAQPSSLDSSYSLVGCRHLIDTRVAQMVIDIFEGCSKIKY